MRVADNEGDPPSTAAQASLRDATTARSRAELSSAIRHLHSELGHPSNKSLARAIRLSGGSDEAIRMALDLCCEVCARRAPPPPIAQGKLSEVREPIASIAVDLFEIADFSGFIAIFINVVCVSSGFQMCGMVESRHPGHIFEECWRLWSTPFGPPEHLCLTAAAGSRPSSQPSAKDFVFDTSSRLERRLPRM